MKILSKSVTGICLVLGVLFCLFAADTVIGGNNPQFHCLYCGTMQPGTVLKYGDSGIDWIEPGVLPGLTDVRGLIYTSGECLFAGGSPGTSPYLIYRSCDYGTTWDLSGSFDNMPGALNINTLLEDRHGQIFAGSMEGNILKSDDNGNTWVPTGALPSESVVYCLHETPAGTLLAGLGGIDWMIVRSTDGGLLWEWAGSEGYAVLVSNIVQVNETLIMATTNQDGYLIRSTDDGMSWSLNNSQFPGAYQITGLVRMPWGLVASVNRYSGGPEVHVSTDNGQTWEQSPMFDAVKTMTLSPAPEDYIALGIMDPNNVIGWRPDQTAWSNIGQFPNNIEGVMSLLLAPCHAQPPTATPRPSPTPRPEGGTYSDMSDDFFSYRDRFLFVADAYHHTGSAANAVPDNQFEFYAALEVLGYFYFYPSWTQDIEFVLLENLPPGVTDSIQIFDFEWPMVDGNLDDIRLWTVLLDAETHDMYGRYDVQLFAYGPREPTATPAPNPTATPAAPEMTVIYHNDDAPLRYDCSDERLYCFGNHNGATSYYAVATIKNTGGANLAISVGISGDHSGMFEFETAPVTTLEPGREFTVRIRFNPSAPPGEKSATLEINGDSRSVEIQLEGGYIY